MSEIRGNRNRKVELLSPRCEAFSSTGTNVVGVAVSSQMYVALQRLEKNKLTGTAIETMRAPAPIQLDHIQTDLYKEVCRHARV